MGSFTTIPTEILTKIIKECSRLRGYRASHDTLANLRLVCKRTKNIATPKLFEKIYLDEAKIYLNEYTVEISEQMQNLVESSLINQAKMLRIGPAVASKDVNDLELVDFKTVWENCSGNLRELCIKADYYANQGGHRKGDRDNLDARYLWKMREMLSDKPMELLKHLQIRAHSASVLFQLFDGTLRPRNLFKDEVSLFKCTDQEHKCYFPNLETIDVMFGGECDKSYIGYKSIPYAVSLLTSGCDKLKHLNVTVELESYYTLLALEYGDVDELENMTAGWSLPTIFPFRFDVSSLTSLVFHPNVFLTDASKILQLLKPMESLHKVSLAEMVIRPPQASSAAVDWSHIFIHLKALKHLSSYWFFGLVNKAVPKGVKKHKEPEERFDLQSFFKTEYDALDKLKQTVKNRRVEMGLPEKWERRMVTLNF